MQTAYFHSQQGFHAAKMLDSASKRPKDIWLKAVGEPVIGFFPCTGCENVKNGHESTQ